MAPKYLALAHTSQYVSANKDKKAVKQEARSTGASLTRARSHGAVMRQDATMHMRKQSCDPRIARRPPTGKNRVDQFLAANVPPGSCKSQTASGMRKAFTRKRVSAAARIRSKGTSFWQRKVERRAMSQTTKGENPKRIKCEKYRI